VSERLYLGNHNLVHYGMKGGDHGGV